MKIEFDLINDIPYLSIKDWDSIIKSDIVMSNDHLDILYDYYKSLVDSVDELGLLDIPNEDVMSIAQYARDELGL